MQDPSKWSAKDVAQWATEVGLGELASALEEHGVSGPVLRKLTPEIFTSKFNFQLGPACALGQHIKELFPSEPLPKHQKLNEKVLFIFNQLETTPYLANERNFFIDRSYHIPQDYDTFRVIYKKAVESNDITLFKSNFLAAMQLTISNTQSQSYVYPLWWFEGAKQVTTELAKHLFWLESLKDQCSAMLIGPKGAGKTTLLKRLAIVSNHISTRLITVYVDLSNAVASPLDILKAALAKSGLRKDATTSSQIIGFLRDNNLLLAFIIDEAQEYYVWNNTSQEAKDLATLRLLQIYDLGIHTHAMMILCGSSSMFPILALRLSKSFTAQAVLNQYSYQNRFDNQKFSPITLNLLSLEEVEQMLVQYAGCPPALVKERSINVWICSGGSIRFVAHAEKNYKILTPNQGPELMILDYLASEQPHETRTDITKLKRIPFEQLDGIMHRWAEYETANVDPALICELVDQQILSARYHENGQMSEVGFNYPAQFTAVINRWNFPIALSESIRQALLDPKTFGERLELFVEECLAKKQLVYYVLCINNEKSNIKEPHKAIFLKDWDPTGQHRGINFLKVFPDDYGIDFLRIEPEAQPLPIVHLDQFKLGGSAMMPGDESTKDSAHHAVQRIASNKTRLYKILQKAFKSDVTLSVNFFVTRKMSKNVLEIFKAAGNLQDQNAMWENVWSQAVINYVREVSLAWILPITNI